MKNTLKVLIGISMLMLLCLSINAISAEDNATIMESTDDGSVAIDSEENVVSATSQEDTVALQATDDDTLGTSQEYVITAKNFKNNNRIEIDKSFRYTISQKDVDDAKNSANKVIYKKAPDVKVKVFKPVKKTVKQKVYKTIKVKTTKKFTCWHLTKKSLKMDKKYFKNYYKYQANGYKIGKGKWIKTGSTWKCVFTATKTKKVKKWTGKYKTRKITQYKAKTLKGIQIQIWGDGVVYVRPDVTGYKNYVYTAGYAIPELCTVGSGTYI